MAKHECLSEANMNRLYDGDLSAGERSALEEHLKECSACRERWDEFVQGEELIMQELAPTEIDTSGCPGEDTLAAYADGLLPQEETTRVREHLEECPVCKQLVLSVRLGTSLWYEHKLEPSTENLAPGVLDILSRLPDAADRVRRWLQAKQQLAVSFMEDVMLPCFEPRPLAAQRLAAETGEGFKRQRLEQPDSPFEVELAQFGREARIIIKAQADEPGLNHCLVELHLIEDDECRLKRSVLVKEGEGRCVLLPDEVEGLRPDAEPFKVEVQPVVTLGQLEDLMVEASVAILSDLVEYPDPFIRRLSVEVLGETGSSQAIPAVAEAKEDSDPEVRRAAGRAEDKLRRRGRHADSADK